MCKTCQNKSQVDCHTLYHSKLYLLLQRTQKILRMYGLDTHMIRTMGGFLKNFNDYHCIMRETNKEKIVTEVVSVNAVATPVP
jgi:hypothetical protein